MAWKWKLTSVAYSVATTDEGGNPVTVDLSKQGQYQAVFDVLDDANAVVDTRTYTLPNNEDRAAARARIDADVARMRDARARVTAMVGDVGTTRNVP